MFSAIIYAVPVQSGRGLLVVFCSSIHTGKEPKGMALSQDGLVKQNDINYEGGMYLTWDDSGAGVTSESEKGEWHHVAHHGWDSQFFEIFFS